MLLRSASFLILIHVKDQGLEQIGFAVVPEVVAFAGAGVADDDVGQHVSHKGVALEVRHAVPGVPVGGTHQVEDLHVIPILTVQLRGIPVELTLGVRHHHRLTALDGLEQSIADHRPGLHGSGSAKDGDVPVQSGIFGHADDLPVGLAQDRALRLLRCRHLQNLLHLLLGHPGSGSIKSVFGDGKATLVMGFAIKLVMELDVGENSANRGQQNQHSGQTRSGEGVGKTIAQLPGNSGDLSLSCHASGFQPFLVVLQHLPGNSAEVEQREQAQYGNQRNEQHFYKLTIQRSSSFPHPERSKHPRAR